MKDNNRFRKLCMNQPARTIFYLVCFVSLFATGCSRYEFITINSYLNKNENNEFVAENDTLRITYTFTGVDFPVTFTVFNKLQQPLYFDAGESRIVMNDNPIMDAFDTPDQVHSILPQSSSVIKSNHLSDKFIPLSANDSITEMAIYTGQGSHMVRQHNFNESTSPVFFSSILAFSTYSDNYEPFFFEHPFWVSGIYQTTDATPNITPSNQFSMKRNTDFSNFMGYTGATVLLIAIIAASASTQDEEGQ